MKFIHFFLAPIGSTETPQAEPHSEGIADAEDISLMQLKEVKMC